ncbi:MAG: glycosyltransferase family 39 protein, partial [Anaerolineae bacterium]
MSVERHRIAILLIVLLAFGLRVYHLDTQSFWSDEDLALGYAMHDVPNLVSTVAARFHTPLYFLTLHYWLTLVGSSDFAIRFLSLLLSTLAVPLLYRLGKSLFNSKVGALAALIIAINPFQIRYAQEARMYSMVLCLSLSSALLFITALREDKKMLWGAYALVTALSMYTHYYACLVPLFEGLFFVISRIRGRYRSLTLPWLASQAAIAVLYSPWLSNILWLSSAQSWQETIPPFSLPWRLLRTYSLGSAIPSEQSIPFALVFLLLLLLGLYAICTVGGEPGSALFSLLYLLVPFSFALGIVSMGRGFLEKYLMVVAPAYYLILAGGLALFPSKRMRWLLLVLGTLFIVGTNAYALHNYYFEPRFYNPDFRSTAEHIETFSQQGDAILFDGPDPGVVFWHYYDGRLPIYRAPSPSDQEEGETVNNLLTKIAARHPRLWLVLYFHPPGPVEFWLNTHGFQAYREEFCNVNLYLYSLPDRQAFSGTMKRPPSAQSPGQIELAGYRLLPQTVESGGMVNLALYWRTVSEVRG